MSSPQQNPAVWDAVAPTYAEDLDQWVAYSREALRLVPIAGKRVLDVACGPGTLAIQAATTAERVDAVDFSPGMITELGTRAKRAGVTNVVGAVMDAGALDFPDQTFDGVFCLFGFMFFPDRAKVFREFHRVLKPGGRAFVATWSPIERRPMMKLAFEAMAEAMPHFPRPSKGDLQQTDECIREMSEGGFRDVTAHAFDASVHVRSAEHYLDIMIRSAAPLAMLRKTMGEEAFHAEMSKLLDAMRKRIPEGGIDLSAEAIFTMGTRSSGERVGDRM